MSMSVKMTATRQRNFYHSNFQKISLKAVRGLFVFKVMPKKLFQIILCLLFVSTLGLPQKHFSEELVCELGNCPEIPLGHSHGGRPPISIDKQLLIFLWFLGTQECVRSISDRFNVTKSSVHVSCRRVCDAIKNNLAEHLIKSVAKWQQSCRGNGRV